MTLQSLCSKSSSLQFQPACSGQQSESDETGFTDYLQGHPNQAHVQ